MQVPEMPAERRSFDHIGVRQIDELLAEQAVRFLQLESARLGVQLKVPRPWHYSGLHNPWARAAACYDSWGFLDLCQSPALMGAIGALIGDDVVLFDSQWLPDRWQPLAPESELESDAHRFPVDPPRGITALIAFAGPAAIEVCIDDRRTHPLQEIDPHRHASLQVRPGSVVLLDHLVPYRVQGAQPAGLPTLFVARYFPASCRYNRDPASAAQRVLTERYPLINYARMPLWLVSGTDRAENDFVTGFNARAAFWTSAVW